MPKSVGPEGCIDEQLSKNTIAERPQIYHMILDENDAVWQRQNVYEWPYIKYREVRYFCAGAFFDHFS